MRFVAHCSREVSPEVILIFQSCKEVSSEQHYSSIVRPSWTSLQFSALLCPTRVIRLGWWGGGGVGGGGVGGGGGTEIKYI